MAVTTPCSDFPTCSPFQVPTHTQIGLPTHSQSQPLHSCIFPPNDQQPPAPSGSQPTRVAHTVSRLQHRSQPVSPSHSRPELLHNLQPEHGHCMPKSRRMVGANDLAPDVEQSLDPVRTSLSPQVIGEPLSSTSVINKPVHKSSHELSAAQGTSSSLASNQCLNEEFVSGFARPEVSTCRLPAQLLNATQVVGAGIQSTSRDSSQLRGDDSFSVNKEFGSDSSGANRPPSDAAKAVPLMDATVQSHSKDKPKIVMTRREVIQRKKKIKHGPGLFNHEKQSSHKNRAACINADRHEEELKCKKQTEWLDGAGHPKQQQEQQNQQDTAGDKEQLHLQRTEQRTPSISNGKPETSAQPTNQAEEINCIRKLPPLESPSRVSPDSERMIISVIQEDQKENVSTCDPPKEAELSLSDNSEGIHSGLCVDLSRPTQRSDVYDDLASPKHNRTTTSGALASASNPVSRDIQKKTNSNVPGQAKVGSTQVRETEKPTSDSSARIASKEEGKQCDFQPPLTCKLLSSRCSITVQDACNYGQDSSVTV